ncbi:ABC transporter ATP-binding protein [Nocardioides sp.]|uniref:ABC transporter ATP-binding protein n=1 Tax=Nocardioides sp. TaxID=35761 RepID=UPI003513A87D
MPTKPEPADHRGPTGEPLLDPVVMEAEDLRVTYRLQGTALSRLLGLRTRSVDALDGVSLRLHRGEVLGVVGESGSGKTTLGRALLGMAPATGGTIRYHAETGVQDVTALRGADLRRLRTRVQMVFQDPSAALNPSMTIGEAVGHPLRIHGVATGEEAKRRVAETLERVGLAPAARFADRYPADLSGGQRQRAVIARAIIVGPEVLVADEPISMLDMSVRAKILQLMLDLKADLGLSYLYITHDLASAKYFCDRIAIMYLGRIVEVGPVAEIFARPRHPYTKALLAAIPDPDPSRERVSLLPRGEIPDAAAPPRGCSFHPRCAEAVAGCGWEPRDLPAVLDQHWTEEGVDFAAERALFEDLEGLAGRVETTTGEVEALLRSPDPERAAALLTSLRDAVDPDPLWRGVTSVAVEAGGVRVRFAAATDPRLRPDGAVQAACVHVPEPTAP